MKKILIIIEISFTFFVLSCIPGTDFDIKNCTGETIEINYDICDDLLSGATDPIEKSITIILENEKTSKVVFLTSNFFNRGVTVDDLNYTETFLSIFENITIKFQRSGIILEKDDLNQCKIEYVRYLNGSQFILAVTQEIYARVTDTTN
jgi:hypothetical protein